MFACDTLSLQNFRTSVNGLVKEAYWVAILPRNLRTKLRTKPCVLTFHLDICGWTCEHVQLVVLDFLEILLTPNLSTNLHPPQIKFMTLF